MSDKNRQVHNRSQRLTTVKYAPPKWFGWTGVLAMFLLVGVRFRLADGVWFFPLLSLGEWLLLPLGVASLTMGFLSLSRLREKTVLPLWIAAILPGILWLAAVGFAMIKNGIGPGSGDLFLAWAVHLVFPGMAFLPLFTMRPWRDRLMWALAAGLVMNVLMIFLQARGSGIMPPDTAALGLGGFLANQHDYGLMLGISLPLLAAWRGGEREKNRALAVMFCTFLLPALTLSVCYGWPGLAASAVGLIVAWAAWRSHAWLLGVFLCLLVVGYGAESKQNRDRGQRRLFADSAAMCGDAYKRAFNTFQVRPFLGSGPEAFLVGNGGQESSADSECNPWYATLLGGSGLVGLGMWLVLLGELAARTMGRFGRRCLWHGGVLGGVAALAVSGLWTDALPEGAGAMVGMLLALSILEEPDDHIPPRPARRRREAKPAEEEPVPAAGRPGSDTDIIPKP